jgi:hypothetical protein
MKITVSLVRRALLAAAVRRIVDRIAGQGQASVEARQSPPDRTAAS